MKKPGLIGGIGPESTVEYYRLIIKRYREKLNSEEYPEMFIHSINMRAMLELVFTGRLDELADFMAGRISLLEETGADYAAIASNTPHIVFDSIEKKVKIPLISIVEETCREVSRRRILKAALFGTKSTMTAGFYQRKGTEYGLEIITPGEKECEYIHEKYMNELVFNRILPETKSGLRDIAEKMKADYGIEGLILGGTELPLILQQEDLEGIEVFDTTSIHVDAIIEEMISD